MPSSFLPMEGPSRKSLSNSGSKRVVALRDLKNEKAEIQKLEHASVVSSTCLSTDCRFLATGTTNGLIKIWNLEQSNDVTTAKFVRSLKGHLNAVRFLTFSSDSERLISSDGKSLRIWHIQTGREMHRFSSGISYLTVRFSPDGKQLAAGGIRDNNRGSSVDFWKSQKVRFDDNDSDWFLQQHPCFDYNQLKTRVINAFSKRASKLSSLAKLSILDLFFSKTQSTLLHVERPMDSGQLFCFVFVKPDLSCEVFREVPSVPEMTRGGTMVEPETPLEVFQTVHDLLPALLSKGWTPIRESGFGNGGALMVFQRNAI